MGIGLTLGHSCHPHFRLSYSLVSRISNVTSVHKSKFSFFVKIMLNPFFVMFLKVRMSCFASLERADDSDGLSSNSVGERRMWKKFSSKELGITNSMISKPTRIVLNGLKRQGIL